MELGCGDGEYTVGLAEVDTSRNYIGVDIKGDRLYQGSTYALERQLDHVAFLRTKVHQLEDFFEAGEVDEFWLTFPDPRPRDRDIRRRLSNPRFLDKYRLLGKKNAEFKFKTDSTSLFDYTLDVLTKQYEVEGLTYTHDLYSNAELLKDHHGIKTKYERIWSDKGEKIKYLKFRFK